VARAVFGYENLAAAEGAAITVDSAIAAHPALKLTDGIIGQRCWLDSHTGSITIDLGDPAIHGSRPWGLVALLGTNLDFQQNVKLVAGNDSAWATVAFGPEDIPVSPANRQGNRWLLLPEDRYERFLRITISESEIVVDGADVVMPGGSAASYPANAKIGQVLVTSPLRLARNFSQNYAVNTRVGVLGLRTQYGVARFYQTHGMVEDWQIPFAMYPREDREKLLAMWQSVQGPCQPLLFVPDPDDETRLAVWCRAVETLQTQFDYWRLHDLGSLTLPIMEEAMPEEL
jgi:hypothetical protein